MEKVLLTQFYGKKPFAALRDYLKNMLGIGKNIDNSIKSINTGLNKLNFYTF